MGNVLTIEHRGDGVGIDENTYGHSNGGPWGKFHKDKIIRLFEYDPLYRLTQASGREHNQSEAVPWGDNQPGGTDYTDARPYYEEYTYDEVGSLTEKKHHYGESGTDFGTWVRQFEVDTGSNRMTKVELGSNEYNYSYDEAGNLIQENTERHYEWDHAGALREFRVQPDDSPVSKYGHYSYDAGGQRVLKVNIQGSAPVSTVYIDGIFEHHRIHHDTQADEENNTLHVMDDTSRIATKRVGPDIFSTSKPATQYHMGDHLGSSNVVIDDQGNFINREEYRPYGETSFGSYEKKRYRFSGKERDEESGLYYHGARYYAPWLARWTAPDPAGMVDGVNLYEYVRGNPVKLVDPDGRESSVSTILDLRPGKSIKEYPERVAPAPGHGFEDPVSKGLRFMHESRIGFGTGIRSPYWNARAPLERDIPFHMEQGGFITTGGRLALLTKQETIDALVGTGHADDAFEARTMMRKRVPPVTSSLAQMDDLSAEDVLIWIHSHVETDAPSPQDVVTNIENFITEGEAPYGATAIAGPNTTFVLYATPESVEWYQQFSLGRADSPNPFARHGALQAVRAVMGDVLDDSGGVRTVVEDGNLVAANSPEEIRQATIAAAVITRQALYEIGPGGGMIRLDVDMTESEAKDIMKQHRDRFPQTFDE